MKIKASARVLVTVEVREAAWGEDCSIGQLYKQAADGAVDKIRSAMNKAGTNYQIIGNPKVIGVMTEQLP